jgi:meiosis-specific transcription factor NDT80
MFHKIEILMLFSSIDHTSSYLPSQHSAFSSSHPVSPNDYSSTPARERYSRVPITNLSGTGRLYQATSSGAERYSTGGNFYYPTIPTDPSRLLPSSLAMPTTSTTYGTQAVQGQDTPPFTQQENFHDITANGEVVKPNIDAKIEKGFFISGDSCWTCYRRNYFAVQCSYTLGPHLSNVQHFLSKDNKQHPIQAMAMSLSARVDGTNGKNIELVQHTPKRDKGPQSTIQMTKLCPTPPGGKLGHLPHADTHHYGMLGYPGMGAGHIPPPHFPLQNHQDAGTPLQDPNNPNHNAPPSPTAHQHTFERIQFKSATANNGKRRAQQQYYHLIVELHADIREPTAHSPKWVKVAERVSSQVVVRGRSPSHYQNEGPNSASNPRGGGTGAGGGGSYTIGSYSGYGGLPTTGGATYSRPLGGSGYMGSGYRGNQLAHDPLSSHTVSSSSSLAGVENFMDHSNNVLLTSTAAPDFMQPAPTSFSSAAGLPSIFMPKLEENKSFLFNRMPPMETSAHTTVYAA